MDAKPLVSNFVKSARPDPVAERIDVLLRNGGFRLERIVSLGQTTSPNTWYDQKWPEWVMVVAGSARVRFEDQPGECVLGPGDTLFIDAHRRHRVTWTDPESPTVWLAIHYDPGVPPTSY